MSMFPHTVTIFTPTTTTDPATMETRTETKVFPVVGVLYAPTDSIAYRNEGKNGADTVKLYIPMNASGAESLRMVPGKSFFVLGNVNIPMTYSQAEKTFTRVNRINTVNVYDFGTLRNWEVGAN